MTDRESGLQRRVEELRDPGDLPEHVAIIMDGNSRWADREGLSVAEGHRRGTETARTIADLCKDLSHINVLSLFAFSTENWGRPDSEISTLMDLLQEYLQEELPRMMEQGVRFEVLGDPEPFPKQIRHQLEHCRNQTANNSRFQLNLALNYGGRAELTRAARDLARQTQAGELEPDDIDESTLEAQLDTSGVPNPDLLIRTSGERRLSNFMLWQLAYTEIVYSNLYWPDFGEEAFLDALEEFRDRERRFGCRQPEGATS